MRSSVKGIISRFSFTTNDLLQGLINALLFSAFLYLAWMGIHNPILNTLFALIAYYRLLHATQAQLLTSGFIIGLLWFYWVGFSFRFYQIAFFIPFVSLGFATAYALVFWLIGFSKAFYLRALLLFVLTFFEPLAFNWLKPELLLVESFFGVQLWQYALILATLALFSSLKKPYAYLSLLLLLGAVEYDTTTHDPFTYKTTIIQSDIKQDEKWLPQHRDRFIKKNLDYIQTAITKGDELIIIPESNFPLFLNMYPDLVKHLKQLSHSIEIITGALYYKDEQSFNATYHFKKGTMQVATKMILVPFGEYIPLPKFLSDILKEYVFNGADDYKTADAPTDFIVGTTKVRSAICYEASCEVFYQDAPKFLIAISNNAWFTPSIEPTLQHLLIKLFSKRYNVTVLHSINGSKSGIISPN